jgi:hypothetical protein
MNEKFISNASKLLKGDSAKLKLFQKTTDDYRSGVITASDLLRNVEKLFGTSNVESIVIPLVAELPEKDKATSLKAAFEKVYKSAATTTVSAPKSSSHFSFLNAPKAVATPAKPATPSSNVQVNKSQVTKAAPSATPVQSQSVTVKASGGLFSAFGKSSSSSVTPPPPKPAPVAAVNKPVLAPKSTVSSSIKPAAVASSKPATSSLVGAKSTVVSGIKATIVAPKQVPANKKAKTNTHLVVVVMFGFLVHN